MKKNIYLVAMTMLSLLIDAQTYTYQWAKTGGATNGSSGVGFNQQADEHVLDMVTDSQNNTYYLVPMSACRCNHYIKSLQAASCHEWHW